jgi:hypothetical protein
MITRILPFSTARSTPCAASSALIRNFTLALDGSVCVSRTIAEAHRASGAVGHDELERGFGFLASTPDEGGGGEHDESPKRSPRAKVLRVVHAVR